jgi:hypothetical protein
VQRAHAALTRRQKNAPPTCAAPNHQPMNGRDAGHPNIHARKAARQLPGTPPSSTWQAPLRWAPWVSLLPARRHWGALPCGRGGRRHAACAPFWGFSRVGWCTWLPCSCSLPCVLLPLSTRCLGEPWCPCAAAAGQSKELPTGSESAAMPQPRLSHRQLKRPPCAAPLRNPAAALWQARRHTPIARLMPAHAGAALGRLPASTDTCRRRICRLGCV